MIDTVLYYLALITPFFWWPVVGFGVWTLWRNRSLGVILVTLGSGIIGIVGSLNAFFGYRASFNADGEILFENPGLLSIGVQTMSSTLGVVFLVAGIVLLLLQSITRGRDA